MVQQSTQSGSQQPSMQECIDACQRCHEVCLRMAMTHCLQMGGKHTEPEHFRLMINCAELCQTAANFMLSDSSVHGAVCGACAEVCKACEESCEAVGDMEECEDACRHCAETCRAMAGTYQPRYMTGAGTGASAGGAHAH